MSKLTAQEKWSLWALRQAEKRELIELSIRQRWALPDWDISFPWWREPSKVRILMYAEGRIAFEGGLFRGLTYVHTLLQSRPYFYVDFEITTAHRNDENAGASVPEPKKLTELDILNKFDEIWMFGFHDTPDLSKTELDLLNAFMGPPKFGGVLVTGDHDNRGKSIAGNITRAGEMRKYPAPKDIFPDWNTSLVEGPDPNLMFDADEQSDDVPQRITCEFFTAPSLPGFEPHDSPHPVLCGPDGPIDVLPDHQHEGEASAPEIVPTDTEWPTRNGYQEHPVIIAKGRTKEPGTGDREFAVLSAYDGHTVDAGRIVADASWHHWFDINLTGLPGSVFYRGFDVSPEGREALKKIDAYFLNCGVWLAPPARQQEMRLAAWWSILWTGNIAELSLDAPLWHLGKQAITALKLYASDCAVSDWILGIPTVKQWLTKTDLGQLSRQLKELNVSLEQFLAGGILKSLMTEIGPFNKEIDFPIEAPGDDVLESLIERGIDQALSCIQ